MRKVTFPRARRGRLTDKKTYDSNKTLSKKFINFRYKFTHLFIY